MLCNDATHLSHGSPGRMLMFKNFPVIIKYIPSDVPAGAHTMDNCPAAYYIFFDSFAAVSRNTLRDAHAASSGMKTPRSRLGREQERTANSVPSSFTKLL